METKGKACIVGLCFGLLMIFALQIIILTKGNSTEVESRIDLSNSTCNTSIYIARKLFFHKCVKEDETVYDLRYFFKDGNILKADIIGIQLKEKEFKKVCSNI